VDWLVRVARLPVSLLSKRETAKATRSSSFFDLKEEASFSFLSLFSRSASIHFPPGPTLSTMNEQQLSKNGIGILSIDAIELGRWQNWVSLLNELELGKKTAHEYGQPCPTRSVGS
jgi:hypothetical protein